MAVETYLVVDENDVIDNVILLDIETAEWTPPPNCRLVEMTQYCGIGWRWDGTQFVEPQTQTTQETNTEPPNVIA